VGTNGAALNANSAHTVRKTNSTHQLIELFAIFAVSAGLTTPWTHDGSQAHGWPCGERCRSLSRRSHGLRLGGSSRQSSAPWCDHAGHGVAAGGNMEGKERPLRHHNSALFATVTTDASCAPSIAGTIPSCPWEGMVPLVNIMLSEVIFGGVGAGMYGILNLRGAGRVYCRADGGRTPEYLGKKIEAFDVKMAMLVALVFPW